MAELSEQHAVRIHLDAMLAERGMTPTEPDLLRTYQGKLSPTTGCNPWSVQFPKGPWGTCGGCDG